MLTMLKFLAILCIVASLIPRLSSDYWLIRVQNYFKAFYLLLNLGLLIVFLTLPKVDTVSFFIIFGLFFSLIVCLVAVARYTSIAPTKVKAAVSLKPQLQLGLLVYNVWQNNDNFLGLMSMVKDHDPDIILLLETDSKWDKGTERLEVKYPHIIKEIREDTYGLKFMSKRPFLEGCINKFVLEGVPSSEAVINLNKVPIRVFGIHPKPPVPGEKLYSTSKDKEIVTLGFKIIETPVNEEKIVIGDFNDVAWSRVSKRFKKLTGLKDPREGRGFYSTFPAYFPLKFPLDHIFLSDGFELVSFKVLPSNGSDHHPVFVKVQLKD